MMHCRRRRSEVNAFMVLLLLLLLPAGFKGGFKRKVKFTESAQNSQVDPAV
jgi:hypothetical protein